MIGCEVECDSDVTACCVTVCELECCHGLTDSSVVDSEVPSDGCLAVVWCGGMCHVTCCPVCCYCVVALAVGTVVSVSAVIIGVVPC